jgi:hypothetical protein
MVILMATAAAKLHLLSGFAGILDAQDPVFHVVTRQVLWLAVAIEIGGAAWIAFNLRDSSSMLPGALLAAMFAGYRLLAWAVFYRKPCPCLGGVLDWLHLAKPIKDAIPLVLLVYMALGSIGFLFVEFMVGSKIAFVSSETVWPTQMILGDQDRETRLDESKMK